MQYSFYENSFLLVSCAHHSGWLYRFHGARSAGGGLNYANSFLVFFLCAPQWCDIGRNQMGYHRSLTTGNFLIMLCCTCNCANAQNNNQIVQRGQFLLYFFAVCYQGQDYRGAMRTHSLFFVLYYAPQCQWWARQGQVDCGAPSSSSPIEKSTPKASPSTK